MAEAQSQPAGGRPFVGVHMQCCNVYIRIYMNASKDAFVGWCPRCTAQIRIPIVEDGGTSDRFFSAG